MNILRSKFTVHLIVCLLCSVMLLPLVAADNHAGDTPVSYHSQIVPILKRSCQGCHHPGDPNGGLIVTTYTDLKQGGMAGDATIVPGKPDDSLIIELISGDEPAMPQNMEPLSAEEVELFRRWILEGAHDDTPEEVDDMREGNYPTYTVPPVVSAIAYSPDGSTLAISGFHEVLLYDTANFKLKARLVGKARRIQSLTYSADGKILGVAGGSPAQFGEVQLWDTETDTLIKAIRSSYDTIYGLSFSPDASRVAFGCSDQTVRVLSLEDEKELVKFDNHSDWVFGTVFSTDGSHFVSAGRDTALKLVEVNTGSFVDDINSSNKGYGEINTIARHPAAEQVISGGEDRIPRLYKIFREIRRDVGNTDFNLIRAFEAQAGSIEAVAFSTDGQRIAIGSAAGEVRIYNVADGKRLVTTQGDTVAVFAVSFHANGTQVAAGGFDGKIRVFDAASGKLINAFMSVPLEATARADVALVVTGMT